MNTISNRLAGRGFTMAAFGWLWLALFSGFAARGDTHVWTGAGPSGYWNQLQNWENNNAPNPGETAPVVLSFPAGAKRLNNTNDITALVVDEISFGGTGYRLEATGDWAAVILRGYGIFLFGPPTVIECAGANNVIASSLGLVLTNDVNFLIEQNTQLTIEGPISGPGGFSKDGLGLLTLAEFADNTYGGVTAVTEGMVDLECGSFLFLLHPIFLPATAIPGPLVIGTTNLSTGAGVTLNWSDQLDPAQPVTVNANGDFHLNGQNQTIGALILNGGVVDTDLNDTGTNFGTLTLNGDLTATPNPALGCGVSGNLSLGGGNRNFNITGGRCIMNAVISDGGAPAGFTKTGPGRLIMLQDSVYTGATTVNEGAIEADAYYSLGAEPAPLVVNDGGQVEVNAAENYNSMVFTTKPLTLSGHGTGPNTGALMPTEEISFYGPVTLSGDAAVVTSNWYDNLTLYGAVSGPGGISMSGPAYLSFAGQNANTYGGATYVQSGKIVLAKPIEVNSIPGPLFIGVAGGPPGAAEVQYLTLHQIADTSAVTINDSGLLNINNQGDTIGSLAGTGTVSLNSGFLDAGADGSSGTFGGQINSDSGGIFVKVGSGSLDLTGSGSTVEAVTAMDGILRMEGQWDQASVVAENVFFGGTATLAKLHAYRPVSPGPDAGAGQLVASSVVFDADSSYIVDLGGTSPGGNYDQIVATTSFTIVDPNVPLRVNLIPGFSGAPGDKFTIVQNNSSSPVGPNTFQGLAEAATITLTNGAQFQITYKGGDGNDIVLTQLSQPPAQIGSPVHLSGGAIQIVGKGVPGNSYTLEGTSDLSRKAGWSDIVNATAAADGTITLVDQNTGNASARFYRVRTP
jgi:autotransporter-associated beta strand protein